MKTFINSIMLEILGHTKDIIMIYLLPFAIILSILVFVHELGHFLVARYFGVKVDVFSIGFGSELFGINDKHGTRWRFSIIPLGGYVKFFGDANVASAGKSTKEMTEEEKNFSLESKTPIQRILVALAGPFSNYLLAIVVLIFLGLIKGAPVFPPIIGEIQLDSPASIAGIKTGDKIDEINGEKINNFEDIRKILPKYAGKEFNIKIIRQEGASQEQKINKENLNNKIKNKEDNETLGKELTLKLSLNTINKETGDKKPTSVMGVSPKISLKGIEYKKLGIMRAISSSFETTWGITQSMFYTIGRIFKVNEIGGMLSMGKMAGESAKMGFDNSLWFLALLSISLGFMNLLPIPVLDGGHVFLDLIELITRKPIPPKIKSSVFTFGFIVVMALMIYAQVADVKRFGKQFGWFSKISNIISGK